jgi:cytidylate kinase-like protein
MTRSSADAFVKYLRAQSVPVPEGGAQRPAIAISRQAGAGAAIVADLVAQQLDSDCPGNPPRPWAVFDRNLIERILEDYHLSQTIAPYIVEDVKFPLTDALEAVLGLHPSSWAMMQKAATTIRRLAMKGNVILVGRGSAVSTARLSHVLQVRLVAPFQHRVRHFASCRGIDEEKAAHLVRSTDESRRRYVREYFGVDVEDPVHYALTINTSRTSFEESAQLITHLVLERTSKAHPQNVGVS